MSTTPQVMTDRVKRTIAASATKREAVESLGVTATYLGYLVRGSDDPELANAWASLPADGAYAGMSSRTPRPGGRQASADSLVEEACAQAPVDPSSSQREALLLLMVAALRLAGHSRLPRGWVLAFIQAFERAGHPSPPTPASLRWYKVRLQQDPDAFSDVPAVVRAIRSMPRADRRKIWRKHDMKAQQHEAADLDDVDALVREACEDSPLDRRRSEGDNAVLLMLALYNITGSLSWPGDWISAVSGAFARAGASLPSRASLKWYRTQLRDDPTRFESIRGVDHQLIEDLLAR